MSLRLTPRLTPRIMLRLAAALSVLVAAACGGGETPVEDPASKAADAPPAPAPQGEKSASSPHTGMLSEADFKALHQLSPDKVPPPRGQKVEINGTAAMYLSLPEGKQAPLPALVVIHEWWGLNDNIRHWTDRLAEDGYAALAVDLYGGKAATTPDEAMAAMKAVDEKKALATVLAAHDFLEKDPRVKATKTGSIGWCFGGAWSLQLALNEPDLDAAVIYYGHLVTDAAKLKTIKAPILGIFANKDKAITKESVDEFEKGLKAAGVENTILRYDADHAFANPSQSRYDEKSSAESWEKVRAFLAAKLQPAK